jgi:hypothetical protein
MPLESFFKDDQKELSGKVLSMLLRGKKPDTRSEGIQSY